MTDLAFPRYPVYIPSKGRSEEKLALTAKSLARDGVSYYLVAEPHQADDYSRLLRELGVGELLVTPFKNLGLGAIPVRNWIRDHAEAAGHAKHWQLDDNVIEFRRLWKGRRIPCHAGIALRVCEDLTDRYENVALSGLNYQMFVPATTPVPFYVNVHVYSVTLINHAAPHRWRLRYNDDTDICLQVLSDGWCTILLNAFHANKMRTMTMAGGMTNEFYAVNRDGSAPENSIGADRSSATFGRFEMARFLERAWPSVVEVRWRFGRPQHVVNWGKFRTKLRLKDDVDLSKFDSVDEYGLTLRAIKEVSAPALREILEEWHEVGPR